MWIYTNQSFLSIVQHRTKPDIFLVRARIDGDIEKAIPNVTVTRTDDADYRYRAEVKKAVVQAFMMRQINSIDYDNFKGSIAKHDHDRHDAYMGVWSVMNRYQYRRDQEHAITNTEPHDEHSESGSESPPPEE